MPDKRRTDRLLSFTGVSAAVTSDESVPENL